MREVAASLLRRFAWLVLASSLGVLLACGDAADLRDPAAGEGGRPNVVLYLVDTLRADALGAYGNDEVGTPAIDALARDGIVFEDAHASSSWTRPSIASLLTGLRPRRHGAERRFDKLPVDVSTLGERLAEGGYATAFITTNPNVGSFFGFDRGFDEIHELYQRREVGLVQSRELSTRSDEVSDRAIAWLRTAPRPFLLVVHTIDPHKPYAPPEGFDVYGGDYAGPVDARGRWNKKGPLDAADQARIRSLYSGEVAFNDESFGRLMSALAAGGRLEDTAVIFTADHGEEFWEQGVNGHGKSLRDTLTRVPLILRLPGAFAAGRRIARPVELIDVAPTVLELAGLPGLEKMDGATLLHPVVDAADRIQLSSLTADGYDLRAARARPWKLVRDLGSGTETLMDLDAGERVMSPEEVEAHESIRLRLAAALDAAEQRGREPGRGPAVQDVPPGMPGDVEEALRALGYLGDDEAVPEDAP